MNLKLIILRFTLVVIYTFFWIWVLKPGKINSPEQFRPAVALIASAQSVGRGGLAVALTKTALGGMLGLEIDLKKLPGKTSRDDFALFSESQGRIIVTVAPENKRKFEQIMKSVPFGLLGKVIDAPIIKIKNKKEEKVVDISLTKLDRAYKGTFRGY